MSDFFYSSLIQLFLFSVQFTFQGLKHDRFINIRLSTLSHEQLPARGSLMWQNQATTTREGDASTRLLQPASVNKDYNRTFCLLIIHFQSVYLEEYWQKTTEIKRRFIDKAN